MWIGCGSVACHHSCEYFCLYSKLIFVIPPFPGFVWDSFNPPSTVEPTNLFVFVFPFFLLYRTVLSSKTRKPRTRPRARTTQIMAEAIIICGVQLAFILCSTGSFPSRAPELTRPLFTFFLFHMCLHETGKLSVWKGKGSEMTNVRKRMGPTKLIHICPCIDGSEQFAHRLAGHVITEINLSSRCGQLKKKYEYVSKICTWNEGRIRLHSYGEVSARFLIVAGKMSFIITCKDDYWYIQKKRRRRSIYTVETQQAGRRRAGPGQPCPKVYTVHIVYRPAWESTNLKYRASLRSWYGNQTQTLSNLACESRFETYHPTPPLHHFHAACQAHVFASLSSRWSCPWVVIS